MSKYAALIEIGWIKKCFEADVPCGVIRKVEEIQNFGRLLRMGHMREGKRVKKSFPNLKHF